MSSESMRGSRRGGRFLGASLGLTLVAWAGLTEAAEGPAAEAPAASGSPAVTVEAVQKTVTGLSTDVKKLKGVKVSGYVQGRYELDDSSGEGVSSKDGKTSSVKNGFGIRRARIKASLAGNEWSEATVEVDAVPKGVTVKDVTASITEPWSPAKIQLTAGQFKVPFGWDNPRSTTEAEFPEPPLMVRSFFPGERERGLRLTAKYKFVSLVLGAYNGNGTEDTGTKYKYTSWTDKNGDGEQSEDELTTKTSDALNFGAGDRDHRKDFSARLGAELGPVTLGVSYYAGQWGTIPDGQVLATVSSSGSISYLGTSTLTYIPKTRLGVDAQLALALLGDKAKTQLRAELIQGHGLFEKEKQADVDALGFAASLVQGLGPNFALIARVDQLDPDTSAEATDDSTLTLEPGLLFFPSEQVKVTASYQIIQDFDATDDAGAKVDKANNHLTLQVQGKF